MRVLLILAVTLICAGKAASGADSTQVLGQWQQSDFLGLNKSSDSCTWVSYQTRKILVDKAPNSGELVGFYSNYEQAAWTLRASDACNFGRPTVSNALFQRARMWPIRLERQGADWRMTAGQAQCTGDWCDDAKLFKSAFSTRVRLEAGNLIDAGDGTVGNSEIVFRPVGAVSYEADAAAARWPGLLGRLDQGECNAFVSESVHSLSPLRQHQGDYCNLARQVRSIQTQPIIGSTVLNSILIDRVVSANGSLEKAGDVLIIGVADFQDGTKAPRITMLRKERGFWKVFAQFAQ